VALNACVVPICTLAAGTDIATVMAPGVGVGVGVPLPTPLLEIPPAQPEIHEIAMAVAKTTQRETRPVRDRFTIESPKIHYLYFFRARCSGDWS